MASLNIRKVTERPQELEPNAIYLISEGAGLFRIEAVSGDGESVLEQTMTLEDIVVADITDSTIVGQNVLKAEDETAARDAIKANAATIFSDEPPENPVPGQKWVNTSTDSGIEYTWMEDIDGGQFVEFGTGSKNVVGLDIDNITGLQNALDDKADASVIGDIEAALILING